jgi:2,4-dienoyl-CoA reductase (NADPH2)
MKGVKHMANVTYLKVDDAGFHVSIKDEVQILPVDHVVICAGQEPLRDLHQGLLDAGQKVHLVGGADVAAQLDAKRAIKQASELVASI